MDNLIQATPFFPVRSIDDAVAFYRDRLGFTVYVQMADYAYVARDKAAIRLLASNRAAPGTAYVDVYDVDAIAEELQGSWTDLPAIRCMARWTKPITSAS